MNSLNIATAWDAQRTRRTARQENDCNGYVCKLNWSMRFNII